MNPMNEYKIEMAQAWLDCFNDFEGRGPGRVCDILDMNYDTDGVAEILSDLEHIDGTQAGMDEFKDFLNWYIEDSKD